MTQTDQKEILNNAHFGQEIMERVPCNKLNGVFADLPSNRFGASFWQEAAVAITDV